MQEGIVCLLVSNYLNVEQSVVVEVVAIVVVVIVTTGDIDIYKQTFSLHVFHSFYLDRMIKIIHFKASSYFSSMNLLD